MANTVVVSRSHLIYGVCLPLAVLLGYLMAEPFESGSVAVVVLVLAVLSVPFFMRWHHPLLIFSCNAVIIPYFVPGHPMLWMIMAVISMFFLTLNRAMGQDVSFFRARDVSISLLAFTAIMLITAYSTGGIGFGMLGASNQGGKRYFSLVTAILLYFALSTIPISRERAGLAVAVFFLSMLTGIVGYLVSLAGPAFYFLAELFPIGSAIDETAVAGTDTMGTGVVRLGGLTGVAIGLFCFLLAKYGVRGVLDLSKPWRLLMLLLAVLANAYSGFRSTMILFLITFGVMFYMENLFRTRYFLALVLIGALGAAIALPFTQKLPLSIQRTLCFLPINIDPVVQASADSSTDWRIEMWKEVIPTVPRYLLKGKGYVLDPGDIYLSQMAARGGFARNFEGALLAGDYHSGPLSLIMPFGIFGAAAIIWFLAASVKVLRQNYRYGDPSLQRVNAFLLAFFIVRIIFFLLVFGSLHSDLILFASLIGLSVSLNSGVCQPAQPAKPSTEPEPDEAE